MTLRDLSLEIACLCNVVARAVDASSPDAQRNIVLAVDHLLRAKSHLQSASRAEGEDGRVA